MFALIATNYFLLILFVFVENAGKYAQTAALIAFVGFVAFVLKSFLIVSLKHLCHVVLFYKSIYVKVKRGRSYLGHFHLIL